MAQSTTNLGKIHVFPSETLYNQFKDIIADNDLALLKDDGAYIVAALLEQNGYVKFSNGLILQWGRIEARGQYTAFTYPIAFASNAYSAVVIPAADILNMYNHNPSVSSITNTSCTCTIKDAFSGSWCIVVVGM